MDCGELVRTWFRTKCRISPRLRRRFLHKVTEGQEFESPCLQIHKSPWSWAFFFSVGYFGRSPSPALLPKAAAAGRR
jgi:hypothetical protein